MNGLASRVQWEEQCKNLRTGRGVIYRQATSHLPVTHCPRSLHVRSDYALRGPAHSPARASVAMGHCTPHRKRPGLSCHKNDHSRSPTDHGVGPVRGASRLDTGCQVGSLSARPNAGGISSPHTRSGTGQHQECLECSISASQ
jgi:hypothetical protein